jgi:hypothetical protein
MHESEEPEVAAAMGGEHTRVGGARGRAPVVGV